jgi:CubicO group peptidase (beta-lactamase class C family)
MPSVDVEIHGQVAPGLEPVHRAFLRNFTELGELGAAAAVELDGELVVDLWGGVGWERDTLVHTFSVTKALSAYCALILLDRGALELDAPVAAYWPGFARAGKERATVRHVLSHRAGLPAIRAPLGVEDLLDWERTIALLEAEPPEWEPGSALGEHALFYGHLVGELVRRTDGRSLGAFWREEVAAPWELDFHIGVPEGEQLRIADLLDPGGRWAADSLAAGGELYRRAIDNPPALVHVDVLNGAAWRAAEIPAVNGHGTARALARFYGRLARGEETPALAEALRPQAQGLDLVLGEEATWGLGFGVFEGGDFGMGGIGGSVGFGNAQRRLGFGYVTRYMAGHERSDAVEAALLEAIA